MALERREAGALVVSGVGCAARDGGEGTINSNRNREGVCKRGGTYCIWPLSGRNGASELKAAGMGNCWPLGAGAEHATNNE